MEYFFQPRGIAVVGATPAKGKGGRILIDNLRRGYTGKIYPVNPKYPEIEGLPCYPSIGDVPDPVDLAIVFVASHLAPSVIDACGKRRIPGVMIQSAGFSETGDKGRALQNEVKRIAEGHGIRLWGPNCMGLVDASNRFVFSTVAPELWETDLAPGGVSLIVQSGMLSGAFLIDLISHGIMGINKVCSIGNKMDVNETDLLAYLIEDAGTRAIGLYLESFSDGRRFLELCRRSPKPVVVLHGGKTTRGAAAAMSHTASLSGDGAIIAGALVQVGVVEARSFYQLMDYCRTLAIYPEKPPTRRNRVAILTYSGGAGIVATDLMDGHGLAPAALTDSAIDRLGSVFPDWMPPANPVDLWPGVILNGAKKAFGTAMEAVSADPNVDAVFVHCFVGGFNLEPDLPHLARMAQRAGKPLVCWISGERAQVHAFQQEARQLSVPAFREVPRAVACLAVVLGAEPAPAVAAPAPETMGFKLSDEAEHWLASAHGGLDEHRSKRILAEAGIPVAAERLVATLKAAEAAAAEMGYPVAAKGVLKGAAHKTELGLVRLGIDAPAGMASAFNGLHAAMKGGGTVLVQQQIEGELELMAGLVRDPQFGPCVMCGLGGIYAEAFSDVVFAVAPITFSEALAMIGRLKCQKLINGFRGFAPLDRGALADILMRLGELGRRCPALQEIDINPFVIHDGRPVAVDALMVIS